MTGCCMSACTGCWQSPTHLGWRPQQNCCTSPTLSVAWDSTTQGYSSFAQLGWALLGGTHRLQQSSWSVSHVDFITSVSSVWVGLCATMRLRLEVTVLLSRSVLWLMTGRLVAFGVTTSSCRCCCSFAAFHRCSCSCQTAAPIVWAVPFMCIALRRANCICLTHRPVHHTPHIVTHPPVHEIHLGLQEYVVAPWIAGNPGEVGDHQVGSVPPGQHSSVTTALGHAPPSPTIKTLPAFSPDER